MPSCCHNVHRPDAPHRLPSTRIAEQGSPKTERLVGLLSQQLRDALGIWGRVVPGMAMQRMLGPRLTAFAEQTLQFDEHVHQAGLAAASRALLARIIPATSSQGDEHIPPDGPLLIVSNHPGLYDAIALAASMPRGDLRIVAKDQAYWSLLPNLGNCLVLLRGPATQRAELRKAMGHLSQGGSLLLFPGGMIEPDPMHFANSASCLRAWSRAPEWFASKLESLTILPATVGGVLSAAALRHPVSRLRIAPSDQRWLSATMQFLLRRNDDVQMCVQFGQPIRVSRDRHREDEDSLRRRIHTAVSQQLQRMAQLTSATQA